MCSKYFVAKHLLNSDPYVRSIDILSSGHGRGKAGEGGAGSDELEGRRETFSYLLTILREAGPETSGLIPAVDVAGIEHLAWTLDALHYLLEV